MSKQLEMRWRGDTEPPKKGGKETRKKEREEERDVGR